MSVKLQAGLGLSGMLFAMIALLLVGAGMVFAFGAIILLSPLTGAVFILILFIVITAFFGSGNKSLYITIAVFLILAILFGRVIQSSFETISPIFRAIEVIL